MSDEQQPEITVRKVSFYQPVVTLGRDDQGRVLYRCPSAGCGQTAYFDEDGKGHCPTDEALTAFLTKALSSLDLGRPLREVPLALRAALD